MQKSLSNKIYLTIQFYCLLEYLLGKKSRGVHTHAPDKVLQVQARAGLASAGVQQEAFSSAELQHCLLSPSAD